MEDIESLRRLWDRLGRDDPLWAVLTRDDRRGRRWEDDEFFATGRREIEEVVALLPALPGDPPRRALDFGCGVGRLTQALAAHFELVVGVDVADSMVAEARRRNRHPDRCSFLVNVRTDLAAFEDASFDFVYSNIVFQHIPPALTLGYLAEFSRVLREGGAAVFAIPARRAARGRGALRAVAPRWVVRRYKAWRDPHRIAMHTLARADVVRHLGAVGLRADRVDPDTGGGADWPGYRYVVTKTA